MNELHCHKKSAGVINGIPKNFGNFAGKHVCRVKCERKSLFLSIQHVPSV